MTHSPDAARLSRCLRAPLSLMLAAALLLLPAEAPAEKAKVALDRCKKGDGAACYRLGAALRKAKKDPKSVRTMFAMACKHGELKGCDDLAVMMAQGQGGPVNVVGAQKLFKQACAKGLAHACYNRGASVYHGKLVAKDLLLARAMFRKSCAGGVASGCANLALMLFRGEGGPKHHRSVVPLFEKGCKGGSKLACKALKTPEIKALRGGGTAGAGASPGAARGKGARGKVSFKNLKLSGKCGGLFGILGLLGGVQKQLLPCLPGKARANVKVTTVNGKLVALAVRPGGKQGACVKAAVRRITWPGGKGTCELSFDVGR